MLRHLGIHLRRNVVAYLALFVALGGTSYAAVKITGAQIVDGTVRSADIRDRTIVARDIRRGGLRTDLFPPGQLNALRGATGAQGPKGDPGERGATGPSFGESRQVPNVDNVACNVENVVGQQTITITRPSRILAFGHGAMRDDGAATTTYGLWLRLRDAGDTETLAVAGAAWDYDGGATLEDVVMPLATSGMMLSGTSPGGGATVTHIAQPGTYRLQLIAVANEGTCAAALPDFGYNQGGGMGYVIVGDG